jgi:hypothetical protein
MLPKFIVDKMTPKVTYDFKHIRLSLNNTIRPVELKSGLFHIYVDNITEYILQQKECIWSGELILEIPMEHFEVHKEHKYRIKFGDSPFDIEFSAKGVYIE